MGNDQSLAVQEDLCGVFNAEASPELPSRLEILLDSDLSYSEIIAELDLGDDLIELAEEAENA